MSKCWDKYEAYMVSNPYETLSYETWCEVWNARGTLDAKLCRDRNPNPDQWSEDRDFVEKRVVLECAKAIEQENIRIN